MQRVRTRTPLGMHWVARSLLGRHSDRRSAFFCVASGSGQQGGQLMTEVGTRDIPLKWDVFVTPGIPMVTRDLPPGMKQGMWSPISSTLIYGKRDAVLVDAFITVEQEDALVDWVATSGKNLTTIYATHGHGDHFFGASTILQRFPHARCLVATPDVVKICASRHRRR